LSINRYQGLLWFNAERFELLIWWLIAIAIIEIGSDPKMSTNSLLEKFIGLNQIRQKLIEKMKNSEYRVDKLLSEDIKKVAGNSTV